MPRGGGPCTWPEQAAGDDDDAADAALYQRGFALGTIPERPPPPALRGH